MPCVCRQRHMFFSDCPTGQTDSMGSTGAAGSVVVSLPS